MATANVETRLREPEAFGLARTVITRMETEGVWPTPLNYELWLHYLSDPEGKLGVEIRRLLDAKEPFTDTTAEMLAAEFLPRGRLSEEIRDAGATLKRELSSVAEAIAEAHRSHVAYGETLSDASGSIDAIESPERLRALVEGLKQATHTVQVKNADLEQRLAASTQEVSRLRDHLEQVRRDAMTDALTNLANRKAFDDHLDRACRDAQDAGSSLCLAVIDIDHFKRFNDTWGHQTGDQVLRYVATVLARVAQAPRLAARYGGEEFALVFPREHASEIETVLNSARAEIASRSLRRRSTNDDLGAVTISIGLAERKAGESAHALLERADEALYASKRGGRNRLTLAPEITIAA